jgi:hypothetical protein
MNKYTCRMSMVSARFYREFLLSMLERGTIGREAAKTEITNMLECCEQHATVEDYLNEFRRSL